MEFAAKTVAQTGPSPAHQPERTPGTYRPHQVPMWVKPMPIQCSLKINTPGDRYEQEADQVAGQIMRTPESQPQRNTCTCGRPAAPDGLCTECRRRQPLIQRKATSEGGQTAVPPIIQDVLKTPGRALDTCTRNFMEDRFRHNFGAVRVHTDARAAASAEAVQARAYTVGANIVFGSGQYRPGTTAGRRLLAHELVHTLQQSQLIPHIQRTPADEISSEPETKDPLCDKYDFDAVRGRAISEATAYQADKTDKESHLSLIRTLKWVRRCAASLEEIERLLVELESILGPDETAAHWREAATAFGGYVGMYPGYAGDIQKRLEKLGTSETLKFSSFKLSETGSGTEHRRKARSTAAGEVGDLGRTDILYFRGHQFAQYRAPGLFSNGSETYGFDLRYVEKAGGFSNVKLLISTSCATLCKEALEVFTKLFPNAVILGYRKSAPLDGKAVRDLLQTKVQDLKRPLLLEESVDMDSIIAAWKSVIEERHSGDTAQLPGYYKGGTVHYWDGAKWQTIGPAEDANKCKRKGDFRGQYPGAPATP